MSRLLDATYHLVHHEYPGGAEALALRLNKSPAQLCHELRPPRGNAAKLGAETLGEVMELSLQAGCPSALAPLQQLCSRFGGMFVPLPQSAEVGDATAGHLVRLASEFGDVMKTIAERSADGDISDNDLRDIQRECLEMVAAVQATMAHIAARNEASKPIEARLRAVAGGKD